ncbi:MAG: hypothetical protein AAGE59_11560 [Cyanobacteria bacterium P01_F01_bin.86]
MVWPSAVPLSITVLEGGCQRLRSRRSLIVEAGILLPPKFLT